MGHILICGLHCLLRNYRRLKGRIGLRAQPVGWRLLQRTKLAPPPHLCFLSRPRYLSRHRLCGALARGHRNRQSIAITAAPRDRARGRGSKRAMEGTNSRGALAQLGNRDRTTLPTKGHPTWILHHLDPTSAKPRPSSKPCTQRRSRTSGKLRLAQGCCFCGCCALRCASSCTLGASRRRRAGSQRKSLPIKDQTLPWGVFKCVGGTDLTQRRATLSVKPRSRCRHSLPGPRRA